MKWDVATLRLLRDCAEQAVRKAAEIVRDGANHPVHPMHKEGQASLAAQVVTEIDLRSQALLQKELMAVGAPLGIGWLGEETPDNGERLRTPAFWCVDPLDGTLCFVEGRGGYSVSVGLVSVEGLPLLGVVCDPVSGDCYTAIAGDGAWYNGIPFCITDFPLQTDSVLRMYYDRSFAEHSWFARSVEWLRERALAQGFAGVQSLYYGGSVLNALQMASHAPAVFFKFPRVTPGGGSLWDYAATACIAKEAGGHVSDIHGASLDLNRPDSTFMNHRGFVYATSEYWARIVMDMYSVFTKS